MSRRAGAPLAARIRDAASAFPRREALASICRVESIGDGGEAQEFLLQLGEQLHVLATPAYRLEDTLARCARGLGVEAQFFSTPTSLFAAFGRGSLQRTHLARVEPGEVDLGKLVELEQVVEAVSSGRSTPREGSARVAAIAAAGPRYGPTATVLSTGAASACAARFFGGGWDEIGLSAGLGLALGLLALLSAPRSPAARVLELVASALVSGLSVLAAYHFPSVAPGVTTLSGLIVLVPGLTLTVAMRELATRHWVAGTARLAGAGAVFLTLGLGVALGLRLAQPFPPAGSAPLDAPPEATLYLALLLAPLAFSVLFRARPADAGWILAAGVLAFAGARGGALALGPELGVFVGALVVGVASNAYARALDRPSSVVSVPGIMLLVPGSIGFQSVSSFLAQDVLSGLEAAFRTALVGAALVGGLLVSNAILPPRRSL